METADIGTQTKRSALKAHSNKSVKMKVEEVIETENIKSCEFEVFGIVQGTCSYLTKVNIEFNAV